jgi:hypothetical protein
MISNRSSRSSGIDNIDCEYSPSLLEAWEKGDYSMLTKSRASKYIKNILVHKARSRPGRRFFGEAFIASTVEMKDGWYASFKWLTSKKWISGHGLNSLREKQFFEALMKHIGSKRLLNLQQKAKRSWKETKGNIAKPVAPDLWLIGKGGEFSFIESKMPWDSIRPEQIAGLKLIKKYLKVDVPVKVSIVNLQPKVALRERYRTPQMM